MKVTAIVLVALGLAALSGAAPTSAPAPHPQYPTVDTQVLKPSCEKLWSKMKHKHEKPVVFKHPSEEEIHKNVYCIPTNLVSFSQPNISEITTGGHQLQYWIDKFQKAGYYHKTKLPDMVRWNEERYESIDNRRMYCVRKAGLKFVPARVHEFGDLCDQGNRFRLHIVTPYFNGFKTPQTWGEAVVYRGIAQASSPLWGGQFPVWGSFDLPQTWPVHHNETKPADNHASMMLSYAEIEDSDVEDVDDQEMEARDH